MQIHQKIRRKRQLVGSRILDIGITSGLIFVSGLRVDLTACESFTITATQGSEDRDSSEGHARSRNRVPSIYRASRRCHRAASPYPATCFPPCLRAPA